MKESLSDLNQFRSQMNEEIHASDHLEMKRFLALNHQAYQDGALSAAYAKSPACRLDAGMEEFYVSVNRGDGRAQDLR